MLTHVILDVAKNGLHEVISADGWIDLNVLFPIEITSSLRVKLQV
jgi:hypothetical protein